MEKSGNDSLISVRTLIILDVEQYSQQKRKVIISKTNS